MPQKSHKDLALEMIQSCRSFTMSRIHNKTNAETYFSTIEFILESVIVFETNFYTFRTAFRQFVENAYLIQPVSKYDRKYFNLAIEHCEDIVNSVDIRFVSGYEK